MDRFLLSLLHYADRATGAEKQKYIDIANEVWFEMFHGDKEYKTKPAAWISTEEGQHIPLDKNGKAIGGAGGWAKGKDFSYAMTKEKAEAWKQERGWTPELNREKHDKVISEHKGRLEQYRTRLGELAEKEKKRQSDLDMAKIEMKDWADHLDVAKAMLKEAQDKYAEFGDNRSYDELNAREREIEKLLEDYDAKLEPLKRLASQGLSDEEFDRKLAERSKLKWEREALESEYYKLYDIAKAKDKVESAERRLARFQSEYDLHKKAVEDLQGGTAMQDAQEYDRLKAEYGTAAKARDAEVLKRFPSMKACETAEQVTDYLRAKGYFNQETVDPNDGTVSEDKFASDTHVNVDNLSDTYAKRFGDRIEKILEDYPALRGKFTGIGTENMDGTRNSDALAYHSRATGMVMVNEANAGKNVDADRDGDKLYQKCLDTKFHLPGTTFDSTIDHEFTHALEKILMESPKYQEWLRTQVEFAHDERPSNVVMYRVMQRIGGSYSRERENSYREKMCKYAARNRGVKPMDRTWFAEDTDYGRNTEWLAEAMEEARASATPRRQAKIVREEFEKLLREGGVI